VRLEHVEPRSTYYYTVDSESANGVSDGVTSPVKSFTAQ
jgi:hypothetical protein